MDPILKIIADNPSLAQALKEVIFAELGVQPNTQEMSNEQLGAIIRAQTEGRGAVENALKKIARLKTTEVRQLEPHPGR